MGCWGRMEMTAEEFVREAAWDMDLEVTDDNRWVRFRALAS